jgi:hypothetical protein
MEHRWGHRHKIDRFVRLKLRNGRKAFGRIRDVSISGAWVTTGLSARVLSYVQIGFVVIEAGRKTMSHIEGLIVRVAHRGFGVEWCEFAHPAVLSLRSLSPDARSKRDSSVQPSYSPHHANRD